MISEGLGRKAHPHPLRNPEHLVLVLGGQFASLVLLVTGCYPGGQSFPALRGTDRELPVRKEKGLGA